MKSHLHWLRYEKNKIVFFWLVILFVWKIVCSYVYCSLTHAVKSAELFLIKIGIIWPHSNLYSSIFGTIITIQTSITLILKLNQNAIVDTIQFEINNRKIFNSITLVECRLCDVLALPYIIIVRHSNYKTWYG